ncbi:MAG: L,D-transpeptidase [Candidatus Latescibacterota bacterium]|nr:MAG: L,D-transpeptidase [Candidatus Latescibacterota bacterium]
MSGTTAIGTEAGARWIADAEPRAPRRFVRRFVLWMAAFAALGLFLAAAFFGTGVAYTPYGALHPGGGAAGSGGPGPANAAGVPSGDARADAEKKRGEMLARIGKAAPKAPYIVIDQTHNRLYLRDKGKTLLEAVCSCGSGIVLSHGESQWVFDTPPGVFRINQKIEDPVWRKPDWAFIEEGKPLPKDPSERFEYDMMGEYAMGFGNGYFIHGTLYERLLGRSVTHGCIRLGREDLRYLYKQAHVGTPVYIF